jgi:replicative DNA helicase Mcm
MHLVINGVVREVQKLENNQKTVYFDRYIDAISIEYDNTDYAELTITPDDEEKIKAIKEKGDVLGQFTRSIAPAIYGYENVKEAIALQLFSEPEITMDDGTHMRGDIHVLLVGDPGIAKSQILRYVSQLSPRGQYANAKTSSGVGLTASVVKSDFGGEHWEVQAGPMVLADKGVLSLDEIEKMKTEHRSDLLEAMEQQTINMAKAGKTIKMMCRACILAAANPVEGRFDPYEDLAGQINMEPYFVSRYDLVFLLRDIPNKEKDMEIATHILKVRNAGELLERKKHLRNKNVSKDIQDLIESCTPEISAELVKKYVAYSKRNIYPSMTPATREYIASFYVDARTPKDNNSPLMITPRQLEGVARLAEAMARMELSETVTNLHAEKAVMIMSECFKVIARDPLTGKTDIDYFYSGVSKAQRDRFKDLKQIIFELAVEYNKFIPMDKLVEKAKQNNIEQSSLVKSLDKLKEIGEIWSPKEGYISPS